MNFPQVFKLTFYIVASLLLIALIPLVVGSGYLVKVGRDAKQAEQAAALKMIAASAKPQFPLDAKLASWKEDSTGEHIVFEVSNTSDWTVYGFSIIAAIDNSIGENLFITELKSDKPLGRGERVRIKEHLPHGDKEQENLLRADPITATCHFAGKSACVDIGEPMKFNPRTWKQTGVLQLRVARP